MQQANQSSSGEINTHMKRFVANQRLVFGVIAFLGLASFALTYVSFSTRIGGTGQTLAQNESPQAQIDQFNQLLAAPFGTTSEGDTADTDKDGITDSQELSLYRTSPYIPDTDGDGKNDGDEVKEGKDPTCAEGKSCRQVAVTTPQPTEGEDLQKLGKIAADLGKQLESQQPEDTDLVEPVPQDISNLSVQEIRDLLLKSGQMTEEQLSKIDDETILAVYEEIVKK